MEEHPRTPGQPSKPLPTIADLPKVRKFSGLESLLLRVAAKGIVPARWFYPSPPPENQRTARTGPLHLELVSHCWKYAPMLAHQLSSLARRPPTEGEVTMTVYFHESDRPTATLLEYFGAIDVPRVRWNWRQLPPPALFRRAIGRNHAALSTEADWIWFTDCDLLWEENCLSTLHGALQGRRDALVFPEEEWVSPLLLADDPLFTLHEGKFLRAEVEASQFKSSQRNKATGPLQIAHGDVARAVGYCAAIAHYQTPSPVWAKAYEDRAFRWLLATTGTALPIPNVRRLRHLAKGRYTGGKRNTQLRTALRRHTDH